MIISENCPFVQNKECRDCLRCSTFPNCLFNAMKEAKYTPKTFQDFGKYFTEKYHDIMAERWNYE